jgi:hypothetical protein
MKYGMQPRMKNLKDQDNRCVVIKDEVERKTGFARGYVMSSVIHTLKVIRERQPGVKVAIQNTTEDLDFYSHILRKLPDVYFVLDKDYASKYSTHSMDEWIAFENTHKYL